MLFLFKILCICAELQYIIAACGNWIFFFLNSYIFPINAAAKYLREGKLIDPCTPKGYLHNAESWKLAPGLLDEKNGLSTLQSNGNFSECRSAALLMLQKGKG